MCLCKFPTLDLQMRFVSGLRNFLAKVPLELPSKTFTSFWWIVRVECSCPEPFFLYKKSAVSASVSIAGTRIDRPPPPAVPPPLREFHAVCAVFCAPSGCPPPPAVPPPLREFRVVCIVFCAPSASRRLRPYRPPCGNFAWFVPSFRRCEGRTACFFFDKMSEALETLQDL